MCAETRNHMSQRPRLILIADRFADDAIAEKTLRAVEAGVRWVHLRDHGARDEAFRRQAARLVEALRRTSPETIITINRRLDVAAELRTAFHTGAQGAGIKAARRVLPSGAAVGYSAHDVDEALRAVRAGADYLFLSPIFPTTSKPGHPGIGLDALRQVCDAVPIPVYALGGVTPGRVSECRDAGAYGVATLSGIEDVSPYIDAVHGR